MPSNMEMEKAYSRNFGFWNEAEQERLSKATVAIAGVGGDGFQLGYKLAMMGVQKFRVADPETFEEENSNRVFGASSKYLGRNKAEVFKEMVTEIRPNATVEIYTEGINTGNVEEFVHGADLVLDESELTRLEIGTMLARTARKAMVPELLVMNIGFSAVATSFRPDGGKTFEELMGIPVDAPIEDVSGMQVDFSRCLPYIPKYGDLRTLEAVKEGAPLPSISQGVDVASALGTTEAFLHLVKDAKNHRRQPTWAPSFRYMDSYNGESGIIRMPRLSYYMGLIAVTGRTIFGLNPTASYTKEERASREVER